MRMVKLVQKALMPGLMNNMHGQHGALVPEADATLMQKADGVLMREVQRKKSARAMVGDDGCGVLSYCIAHINSASASVLASSTWDKYLNH